MTVANPILPDYPILMTKGEIRHLCSDAYGRAIRYDLMMKFIGEEVCTVVDYKSKHQFFGDELLVILQRLFPRKYGRLEENEWYLKRLGEKIKGIAA